MVLGPSEQLGQLSLNFDESPESLEVVGSDGESFKSQCMSEE